MAVISWDYSLLQQERSVPRLCRRAWHAPGGVFSRKSKEVCSAPISEPTAAWKVEAAARTVYRVARPTASSSQAGADTAPA